MSKIQFEISASISGSFNDTDTVQVKFDAGGGHSGTSTKLYVYTHDNSGSSYPSPAGNGAEATLIDGKFFSIGSSLQPKSFVAPITRECEVIQLLITGSHVRNPYTANNARPAGDLKFDNFDVSVHQAKVEITDHGILAFSTPERFLKADKDGVELRGGSIESQVLKTNQLEVYGQTAIFSDLVASSISPYSGSISNIASGSDGGEEGLEIEYARGDHTHGLPASVVDNVIKDYELQRITASEALVKGDMFVSGTLEAIDFVVQRISSSVIHLTGSNTFGDSASQDTHYFTGSIQASGSSHEFIGSDISLDVVNTFKVETDALVVSSSRKIGIGNTAPDYSLDIKASGNDDGLMVRAANGQLIGFLHQQNTDAGMFRLYDASSTEKIILNADANQTSYINNGGSFAIGTSTAAGKLTVEGNISSSGVIHIADGSETAPSIAVGLNASTGNAPDTGIYKQNNGRIGFTAGGDGQVAIHNRGMSIGESYIANSAATINSLIVEGRIGAGTDSPDYTLDVAGAIGVNDYIHHNGDSNTYVEFKDDYIELLAGGGTNVLVVSQSTVGIGTATPSSSYAFNVDGNIRIDGRITLADNVNNYIDVGSNIFNVKTNDDLHIFKGSQTGLYYKGTGNYVGIATTTPSKALTVEGDISSSGTYYNSTNKHKFEGDISASGNLFIGNDNSDSTASINFGVDTSDVARIFSTDTGTATSLTMEIKDDSNDAINIRTKGHGNDRVDRRGDINLQAGSIVNRISADNPENFIIEFEKSSSVDNFGSNITSSFIASGSGDVYIPVGDVGIGTTSPLSKLHIKYGDSGVGLADLIAGGRSGVIIEDSNEAVLTLAGGTSNNQYILFGDSDSATRGRLTYSNSTDALSIWTSDVKRAEFDDYGVKIIGDISASGKIIAQEFVVSSSVIYQTEIFASGSSNFGDSTDDIHSFTGSVNIIGNMSMSAGGITASKDIVLDRYDDTAIRFLDGNGSGTSNYLTYRDWKTSATAGKEITNTTGIIKLESKAQSDGLVVSHSRVGIGQSPLSSAKLTVDGVISASDDIRLDNNKEYTILDNTGAARRVALINTSNALAFGELGITNNYYYAGNTHRFITDYGTTAVVSNNKVGIGTDTPATMLHLKSGSEYAVRFEFDGEETFDLKHGTSGLYWNKNNYTLAGITQDHDFAVFDTSGDRYANFDGSAGRFGIGWALTAPTAPLHISMSDSSGKYPIKVQSTGSISYMKFMNDQTGTSGGDGFDIGINNSSAYILNRENSHMIFCTNNTEYLRLKSDGNFGIGSSNPSKKLTVGGSISASGDLYLADTDGSPTLHLDVNNGSNEPEIKSSGATLQINKSNGIDTSIDNGTLYVDASANRVGIGTTGPSSTLDVDGQVTSTKLNVKGSADEIITLTTTDDSWLYMGFRQNDSTRRTWMGLQNDLETFQINTENGTDKFKIQVPSFSNALFISSSKKIGIGTQTPTELLHLYSSTAPALRIQDSTNDASIQMAAIDSSVYIGATSNHQLNLRTNNTNQVSIKNSGEVGIGTENPAFKLDVIGDAAFKDQIGTASFGSGFAGHGWRIENTDNKWGLTTDNLTVRGTMNVYELLVNQTRATNGSVWVSSTGKIISASIGTAPSFSLFFDTGSDMVGHGFREGDLIRAQRFQGTDSFQSDMMVVSVGGSGSLTAITTGSGTTPPSGGFEYVRIGNAYSSSRQGAVYMTADDNNAPYIDVIDGVASHSDFNANNNIKARLGKLNGISSTVFGNLSGYGLYSDNVYLEGGINSTFGAIGGFGISATALSSSDNTFILSSSEGNVAMKMGSTSNAMDISSGTGIFMSGSGDFRVGNPSADQLKFHNGALQITASQINLSGSGVGIDTSTFELDSSTIDISIVEESNSNVDVSIPTPLPERFI